MLVGPFVCAGPAPMAAYIGRSGFGSGQRNATMMPTAASISPVMITATNQRAAIIVRPQKRSVFIFLIGLRGPGRLTSVKLPENAAFGPLIARAHSNEDTKGCERECRRFQKRLTKVWGEKVAQHRNHWEISAGSVGGKTSKTKRVSGPDRAFPHGAMIGRRCPSLIPMLSCQPLGSAQTGIHVFAERHQSPPWRGHES